MKRIYILLLLNIIFYSISWGYNKQEADSAYINEDYVKAISIYKNILEIGESAEIYYNLGNCYYKVDSIGKAILNYERSLLLNPASSDTRVNLEIALSKTVDKLDAVPDIFFVAWISSLINSFSVKKWAYCGICFFIFMLITLGIYFFSKTILLKKASFISTVILLLVTILCNIFAYNQKYKLQNRNQAIVMSPSVTIRSTPSESGTSLFILHEGSKVKIKDDSMKDWKEILLEDGKVGWIPVSSLEVI